MPNPTPRLRGTIPPVEQAARRLRNNLTPAEAKLWHALKRRQLSGYKFRSQHPVGRFILAFYCPACKLAIEVDGPIHKHQQDYDAARTAHLEEFDYQVIRFSNEEIMQDFPSVLQRIRETLKAPQPPNPGEHR